LYVVLVQKEVYNKLIFGAPDRKTAPARCFSLQVQAGAMFRQQEKPRVRVAEIRLPPQTNYL
jgi:hypothetical protein